METMQMEKVKKLVPQLRFKGFDEEWKIKQLGDVSKFLDGKRKPIKSEDRSKMKGEYPYYGASGIIDYVNSYIFDQELILLGEDGENIISRNLPLAFRVSGKCWINNHAHVIVPNLDTNIDFLTHSLEKINYVVYNTGTAQPKLNQEVCRSIPSWYPSLLEQQKIASFLSAVDEKIQQLTRKKELLEQYKKGVMQKIFSQELRFKDDNGNEYSDWEEKKLGEAARITTGSSNRQDSNLDGEYTFFDRSQDIRSSNIFLFDTEAIIVPGEGQEFIPKYYIGKFDLHQRTYAVMDFGVNLGKFLFYYISFHSNHLNSHAVGSTVKSLRLPMFERMPIKLPCIQEQQKIASILSIIDVKIESTTKQITQTQTFKKGLLQKMFV